MAMRTTTWFGSYNSFRPFIFTVNSGADSQFTIPTQGTGYNYRAKVTGVVDVSGLTGSYTINFPSANTDYIIEISGLFPQWLQNFNAERLKVKDVMQCGDVVWRSFQFAFYGCSNMTWTATDIPKMSLVTDMLGMVASCTNFNTNINNWDVSNVTDMLGLFERCTSFNQPLNNWDVSNVTNMAGFLNEATSYAQNIDFTNALTGSGNVTNMSFVFYLTKIKSLKLDCTSVTTADYASFFIPTNEIMILNEMPVSFVISYNPLLTGTAIDNLANSVKDMTGFTSPTVTMTTAQKSSCDITLWANKNWTIATV